MSHDALGNRPLAAEACLAASRAGGLEEIDLFCESRGYLVSRRPVKRHPVGGS